MYHIFISYSRRNVESVTKFAESLRKMGFDVWQDISGKSSGIPYSVKWLDVIEEAIFTASAAVVFRDEAWEASEPCKHELRLIKETELPLLDVAVIRLISEETAVLDETVRLFKEKGASKENIYRTWMLAGAYRIHKGLPSESYLLTGSHVIRNWQWLRKCNEIVARKNFQGPWAESLHLFLRKNKHKLWGSTAVRGLVGISLFAAIVWILSVVEVLPLARIANETAYTASQSAREMRQVGEYDPIQSIQEAAKYNEMFATYAQDLKEYGDKEHKYLKGDDFSKSVAWNTMYFSQSSVLSELLSRNYPVAFYESVADCPINIFGTDSAQSSDRYSVSLSADTGQVFIDDQDLDTTRQLVVAEIPKTYCFNDSGDRLALAAGNKAYAYDLLGEAPPRLLTYNFEKIRDLAWVGDQIYAATENGHVIVWDDPMPARKIHRKDIASGALLPLGDGGGMAVYTDDDCLIKNIANKETVYPLSLGGTIDRDNIAVSSDGAYAAISYRPDGGGSDWIGLIDLMDGTVKQRYDTGFDVIGYAFSPDNGSLIVTCYDALKIARIDLNTGAIMESSEKMPAAPYSLVVHEDKILVCDVLGFLVIFNDDLELIEDGGAIGHPAPQKQLAVSEKYDCLLTAGRGGNAFQGFNRTWLSSDERATFIPVLYDPMLSTTSVAVTSAGDYVAYGNAGGSIYIWDVGAMERVWDGHRIPESIIRLRFSDDSKALYALGSSGTIYEVDISDVVTECRPEDPRSIWEAHMKKADEISKNMERLGLGLLER